MIQKKFGLAVKKYREQLGLSQENSHLASLWTGHIMHL